LDSEDGPLQVQGIEDVEAPLCVGGVAAVPIESEEGGHAILGKEFNLREGDRRTLRVDNAAVHSGAEESMSVEDVVTRLTQKGEFSPPDGTLFPRDVPIPGDQGEHMSIVLYEKLARPVGPDIY
jgi:hypothetical protein